MNADSHPSLSEEPHLFLRPPSFDFTIEEERAAAVEYLSRHGYVVAKAVLSKEETEKAKSLFWDFVEQSPSPSPSSPQAPISRHSPATWTQRNAWPGSPGSGILSQSGIGQSPFQWFVRSRPSVMAPFVAVWDTDDLICSFDGACAFRPWKIEMSWRTFGGWTHVDQNPIHRQGKQCIQGLVTLFDVTTYSGGLTVIPGSHLHFESIGRMLNVSHRHDFVEVPQWCWTSLSDAKPTVILCDAGDMCLWDSRTIHCSTPGTLPERNDAKRESDENEKVDLLRLVSFQCMVPASWMSEEVCDQRIACVRNTQTTTHWPHICVPTCPPTPAFENPYINWDLVRGRDGNKVDESGEKAIGN